MKIILIGAGSDLGIHIDGCRLAPRQLLNDLTNFYKGESVLLEQDSTIIKSRGLADKRKNIVEIQKFNKRLYEMEEKYLEEGYFPITIGGDHSVAIASALANAKKNETIGMIWLDAHVDLHTFDTTPTGNINELSLTTITGYGCRELRDYHTGNIIPPQNTVIIGARNIDKKERENIKYSGVTVFTMDDIKAQGIEAIMEQAFTIAGTKTNSIHISYDLNVLNLTDAPGVSIPEEDGLTEEERLTMLNNILTHINQISSFDLVEFNPTKDETRKTEQIAVNILAKTITTIERK